MGKRSSRNTRGEWKNSSRDGSTPADAAASQFADKVIGDFYAGSTHAGRYETIEDDEDDETIERNHAPSGYMLARWDRFETERETPRRVARRVEKCWRAMASKTSRVVLERVACVATFTRAE